MTRKTLPVLQLCILGSAAVLALALALALAATPSATAQVAGEPSAPVSASPDSPPPPAPAPDGRDDGPFPPGPSQDGIASGAEDEGQTEGDATPASGAKPAQAKPGGTAPDEAKPDEAKPDEAKPDEAKPDEAKPDEAKPDEAKPDEAKPDEMVPDEAKPDEMVPDEAKPDEMVPDEAKPDEAGVGAKASGDASGVAAVDAKPAEGAGPAVDAKPAEGAAPAVDANPAKVSKPPAAAADAEAAAQPSGPSPAGALQTEAEALYRKGLYPAAKDKAKEWADAAAKEFGPEGPKTLAARVAYARALSKAGYFPEAEAYARELEPTLKKASGEVSPEVMALEDILGYAILYQDKEEDAFRYFTKLDDQRKALFPHKDNEEAFIAARARLQAKRAAGHSEPSDIQAMRDVLAAQVAFTFENEPEVLETRLQLASSLYESGVPDAETFDFSEVTAISDAVTKVRIEMYGPEHPDVSEAMALSGFVMQLKGELPKSREVLEKVMAIEGATLGPDHPWSVNTYMSLAWLGMREKNYESARSMYRRAVDARIRFYGNAENAKSCEARMMLARALVEGFKDYVGAQTELEIAYSWREEHLGAEHPETLRALTEVAGMQEHLGNFESARTVFDRVLKSRMA
ncbi:MAG: tetratricopeptide repeat protein, partial [Deltaproteobacteria bacterium]|nr:tetratricopeptide repeat protein [Deltaproteobacteria bacterium]